METNDPKLKVFFAFFVSLRGANARKNQLKMTPQSTMQDYSYKASFCTSRNNYRIAPEKIAPEKIIELLETIPDTCIKTCEMAQDECSRKHASPHTHIQVYSNDPEILTKTFSSDHLR